MIVIICLLILVPFFWMITNSLKTTTEYLQTPIVWFPKFRNGKTMPRSWWGLAFGNIYKQLVAGSHFCCIIGIFISLCFLRFFTLPLQGERIDVWHYAGNNDAARSSNHCPQFLHLRKWLDKNLFTYNCSAALRRSRSIFLLRNL